MAKAARKATVAHFAATHFEPVLGLTELLGSRAEWLAKMGDRYPTMWVGAATMAMTVEQVTAMAAQQPEAVAELITCIADLKESLEAERRVMESASARLLCGCARAGLV